MQLVSQRPQQQFYLIVSLLLSLSSCSWHDMCLLSFSNSNDD